MFENSEQKFIFSDREYNVPAVFLLSFSIGVYILLRLSSVARDDLWYDELFSVLAIRQNWAEMFSTVIQDGVHPPLFYVLLKFWSLIDPSVWWLQGFPFLISILTLVPLFLLCRELKLTLTEIAFVFLTVAVNEYFLEYALDLRMYGLVQFFSLFSLWIFVKLLNSNEARWNTIWILASFNLLLVYTHYFGWLIVGFQGLYLIVWQKRLFFRFAVSSACVLVCFTAWIWLVVQNAANGDTTGNLEWLTRPTISDFLWFYSTLNGNLNIRHTTFVNLLIFMMPVCFLFWNVARGKIPNFNWRLITVFAFAPVVVAFVSSYLLPKPVWQSRYLIVSAIPYVILFVKSLFSLPGRSLRFLFVAFILVWSLTAGFYNFLQTPEKIRWSAAAEKIKSADAPVKTIYVFENWVALPLRFYLDKAEIPARVEKRNSPGDITEQNFWLALRFPISEEGYDLPEVLQKRKCGIAERSDYSDGSQTVSIFKIENCQQ